MKIKIKKELTQYVANGPLAGMPFSTDAGIYNVSKTEKEKFWDKGNPGIVFQPGNVFFGLEANEYQIIEEGL
jgi:hypothetical protein